MKMKITALRPIKVDGVGFVTPPLGEHEISDPRTIAAIKREKIGHQVRNKAAASAAPRKRNKQET